MCNDMISLLSVKDAMPHNERRAQEILTSWPRMDLEVQWMEVVEVNLAAGLLGTNLALASTRVWISKLGV